MIQHLYQCTHKESRSRWTSLVESLRKWLEDWNTDPDIAILLAKVSLLHPRTCTTHVFHSHWKQKTGLRWAIQLITQIYKFIYGQWIHHSKLKHTWEALVGHAKEMILDAEITDEHKQVQDTLPYRYNPYFGTPLYIILDTSTMARKNGPTSSKMLERRQAQTTTQSSPHPNLSAHG